MDLLGQPGMGIRIGVVQRRRVAGPVRVAGGFVEGELVDGGFALAERRAVRWRRPTGRTADRLVAVTEADRTPLPATPSASSPTV